MRLSEAKKEKKKNRSSQTGQSELRRTMDCPVWTTRTQQALTGGLGPALAMREADVSCLSSMSENFTGQIAHATTETAVKRRKFFTDSDTDGKTPDTLL